MIDRSRIQQRHSIFTTEYTLCLEPDEAVHVIKPTELLIAESVKDPELLFKIEPRTFEELVADIFKSFGYQVELTARTRDGGKDIVCLSRHHGIPLKLAIEVKRYAAHRPVSVELVRGFVGAGEALSANKLVYVSTSGYTKDAIKYANDLFISRKLDLKNLDDVLEWCRDCSYRRFGKSGSPELGTCRRPRSIFNDLGQTRASAPCFDSPVGLSLVERNLNNDLSMAISA